MLLTYLDSLIYKLSSVIMYPFINKCTVPNKTKRKSIVILKLICEWYSLLEINLQKRYFKVNKSEKEMI